MIQRDPKYYLAGYKGKDPFQSPLYLRALVFDGRDGAFNVGLVNGFNDFLRKEDMFPGIRLNSDRCLYGKMPSRIVVVNASHDNLPTSYETARVFEDFCKENAYTISVNVVNTYQELMDEVMKDPEGALIMSQCVDKHVYNVSVAEDLEKLGVVIVPGKVTAPGGVFSDKDSTYRLLSEEGKIWTEVARYRKVPVEGREIEDVVEGIFAAIDELAGEIGETTFFVKPHEGGGGLGGFRIARQKGGYIIPDLSKVSGNVLDIHPTFIDLDMGNKAKLRELLWTYRLFSKDEQMSLNYLKVKLPVLDVDEDEALSVLKDYLTRCEEKRKCKLDNMVLSGTEARRQLVTAINVFEEKFQRRYTPLVNEHLDFGLWGLRAHYRMAKDGPVLETIYHRVFQLGFTEEGPGYVGSDNISNKQTGQLEILRLGPVNETMLASIGGQKALFDTLLKGAKALVLLANMVSKEDLGRVPLRLQLDLAAVSMRIGEGNADTARGLSIASSWPEFVKNTREWFRDSLAYYSWKKENREQ